MKMAKLLRKVALHLVPLCPLMSNLESVHMLSPGQQSNQIPKLITIIMDNSLLLCETSHSILSFAKCGKVS